MVDPAPARAQGPARRAYNPPGEAAEMERRRLGRTDLAVSVLGFGGSEIGYQGASARTVARLLGSALDAGLNVVDTAECYEDSERLIGQALRGRRAECLLLTKCGHAGGFHRPDWRPEALRRSIERSLARLETDYLDLIQLHSCSLETLRRGDAIEALERARERGWARYLGYSGDGAAARYAVACGRFDVLQISVSLADQEAIDGVLPLARARGLGVIAKRPLANAAWTHARRPAEPYYQEYWRRLRTLAYPFLADGAEAAATALRFTLTVPGVHTAIVGTARPGRWAENAAGLARGPLPRHAYEAIRRRWREVAPPDWTGQT
jgi:aryl-alcohol dehydrogenase-like predicted oxidoreductase